MKKTIVRLLSELLKDSKKSDRELAKVIGVSQPTVSRIRNKLVQDGLIKEFTVIPDLERIGFEILAISTVRTRVTQETMKKAEKWMKTHPNIIFWAEAEGMGKNGVMISLHKNYGAYSNFVRENLQYWGDDIEDYDTLLVSLRGTIAKPLSLSSLSEIIGNL